MPIYFLLLEADTFHRQLAPALATARRQRRFAPCRPLCVSLLPAARAFAERYHTRLEESLLYQMARAETSPPFDRDLWRYLAGEVLLYAAAEVPEPQLAPETLGHLLGLHLSTRGEVPRERFVPIQQVHFGSRDLVFGGGFYRPEHAGYNDRDDVARLAQYLAGVDTGAWSVADLEGLPGLAAEDGADELELARECWSALKELYERAAGAGQVVVCEVP